jgi:hypothetical protein
LADLGFDGSASDPEASALFVFGAFSRLFIFSFASSIVLGAFSLLRRTARTALLTTPDCSSGAQ